MKRRSVLTALTAGATVTAGCLGYAPPTEEEPNPTRPAAIIGHDFETAVDTDADVEDGPKITADRGPSTVTVEGIGSYGSAACGYLDGQRPSYNPEDSELSVTVTAEQDRSDDTVCHDVLLYESYRFVVRFDEGIPARVEAEHPFEQRTTREF